MADFYYELANGQSVKFSPNDGWLDVADTQESQSIQLSKGEAINLASKLLQWGTS